MDWLSTWSRIAGSPDRCARRIRRLFPSSRRRIGNLTWPEGVTEERRLQDAVLRSQRQAAFPRNPSRQIGIQIYLVGTERSCDTIV